MLRVFGIRRCDTMSRAMAWLNEQQLDFHLHDYKKDGVPVDRLAGWMERVGWQALVNTRGTTFRKLPPEQTADLDNVKALKLLTENPSAIRRPIIEHGTDILIGFDPARWSETFK
ncbi:MAG: Spx/MgsR family RNA polymerase-binding regulatory protein [Gammaproteobacteria bacterium]|jgi:arsenate reductase (glutaredoxin)|nr:Spx/MgsR family RNA polymerase-binding regulatory protein [Gammaproteobacteria bacterium]MBU0771892.1 Spx/MgsR family RNA polymerase-binding regulatory protein [Gammaproteobacteria bacterium]MBU0856087.1 Spx/MgsR family RNA polymerase-binding regulatory protein [Gammaproteobacteria bacterium]MBU1846210.1 Spx/MgsR family RNA polymerase-binding regulatory protein [Gammaproteobacteria bacterium]